MDSVAIQLINRISGVIALILFSAMFFLFIHSELDIFDCHNNHNHLSHDFCLLVQNTTDADDDIQSSKICNLLNDHSVCIPATFDTFQIIPPTTNLKTDKSTIPISKFKSSLTSEILRI